jgi:GWxTD domain-containing protein
MKKIACLLILVFGSILFAIDYDKWADEDVKAIMTKQERDSWKKLKTDAEKEKFVQDFWTKRDPSPGTPENEYKANYEKMLADINSKIQSKSRKGSETDLGMTVLLLGGPDDQKKEEPKQRPSTGDEEEAPPPVSPKMTFFYKKLPAQVASGEVAIEFTADANSGEWKFSDRKKVEPLLDKAREYNAQLAQMAQKGQPAQQPAQAAPPTPAPTQAAGATTPEVKTALDAAAAGNAPKDVPIDFLVDAFLDSNDSPFVTVAVNSTADTGAAKVGVRVSDASGTTVKELEKPYVETGEPKGYFQAEVPLTAGGEYPVAIAVVNGGKASGAKQSVKTPDTGTFSMSSVILSNSFSQLPEAKPEGVAYTFGKIKVQPNVSGVFEKTNPNGLTIVYETYNFQIDPATAKPNLEVTYEFQKDTQKPQKTPPAAPNGLVTGKKMTIPTNFPLDNFPAGKYKLTVTVTDKANNQTVSRQTSFTVK